MKRIATRQTAPGAPAEAANAIRRTGYVTETMIQRHGSYANALAVLNGKAA